jgi:hypothetical protein
MSSYLSPFISPTARPRSTAETIAQEIFCDHPRFRLGTLHAQLPVYVLLVWLYQHFGI